MLKIIYKKVYLGGAETLLVRIGKFFLAKGVDTTLYCEEMHSEVMRREFEKCEISIIEVDDAAKSAFQIVNDNDIFLTVSIYDYIECLIVRQKRELLNTVFYYVVHPYDPLHQTRSKLIDRITRSAYNGVLETSINSGFMFFMDELCTKEYSKFYNVSDCHRFKIIYLPMFIQPLDNTELNKRVGKRKVDFNILTIARSEFPFKGYLKSLITFFVELSSKYPFCRLTILSSGKDIMKLQDWIQNANRRTDRKIELIEDVPYSDLWRYYEMASLYIGQGTTLLEACNYGVPTLPVESYTYELKSKGFFDEVNGCLGVPFGTGEDATHYITSILNMSDKEYHDLLMRCRCVFESKHNIENFYKYIVSCECTNIIRIPMTIVIENIVRKGLRRIKRKKI